MSRGIDARIVSEWHSDRVGRPVRLVRWGHWGQPLLLFPTAGGDAEECYRMGLVEALAPLMAAGRLKVYSCDSVSGRTLLQGEGTPQHRMAIQDGFHRYVRHEVVPAIRMDCREPQVPIWTAGGSFGAFHAVAVLCRFPDVFTRAVGMSGTYDLSRFFQAQPHEFTEHFRVSSPLHFLHRLEGRHLEVLRQRFVLLMSGQGRAEDIGESWAMANALGRHGVPNRYDNWGPQWHHDWPTWRAMLPGVLTAWTHDREDA
jgi:esterase/lipase superfamily enzyme